MPRRIDWRRVKVHRSYTYSEAARVLGVHKNTVANWVKREGLPALTERKPHIILGQDLRDFLRERREKTRTLLSMGEMYCLGCKAERKPAEGMVEEVSGTTGAVMLRGLCPVSHHIMSRRVARRDLVKFLKAVAGT